MGRTYRATWTALCLAFAVACTDTQGGADAVEGADNGIHPDAATPRDAAPDSGAGNDDAAARDVPGVGDGGPIDTGTADAGSADAPAAEAGADGGDPRDALVQDLGPSDSGSGTFGCGLPPPPPAPGEQTCPGCPALVPPPTVFSSTVGAQTSTILSGVVANAVGNGQFFVLGAGGRQLFGTVPVDAAGNYQATVPLFCGAQRVVLVFCNTSGRYALFTDVFTTNCVEPDIRATIVWDDLGDDWELHLIRPGGTINDNATDCTWTSCIGAGPDWGVLGDPSDDPTKDVDDVDGYGPENILLSGPESGVYTVMIEHWGSGSPQSDGQLILNVAGQVVVVDVVDLPPQFVRTGATIEFPGPIIRTSTAVHDCTLNWSGGCRDPIP